MDNKQAKSTARRQFFAIKSVSGTWRYGYMQFRKNMGYDKQRCSEAGYLYYILEHGRTWWRNAPEYDFSYTGVLQDDVKTELAKRAASHGNYNPVDIGSEFGLKWHDATIDEIEAKTPARIEWLDGYQACVEHQRERRREAVAALKDNPRYWMARLELEGFGPAYLVYDRLETAGRDLKVSRTAKLYYDHTEAVYETNRLNEEVHARMLRGEAI